MNAHLIAVEINRRWDELSRDGHINREMTLEAIVAGFDSPPEQVPGCWECPKCGFGLTKSILHTLDGGISANTEPFNELCPNDGTLMVPLTYKLAFQNLNSVCKQQIERAYNAEQKHDKVTEFVARFLVPWRMHLSESWLEGFVECGAVTIDKSYPYGFVKAVKIGAQ